MNFYYIHVLCLPIPSAQLNNLLGASVYPLIAITSPAISTLPLKFQERNLDCRRCQLAEYISVKSLEG